MATSLTTRIRAAMPNDRIYNATKWLEWAYRVRA